MPVMKIARIATSDGQTARLKAILEAGLRAVPAQSPNDGDRKLVDYVVAQLDAAQPNGNGAVAPRRKRAR